MAVWNANEPQDIPIYLIGDSIFDNERYARMGKNRGPSVIQQLQHKLRAGPHLEHKGDAQLLAVDGDVIAQIERQVKYIPQDEECFMFVSVGGNDLLRLSTALARSETFDSAWNVLDTLRTATKEQYAQMVSDLVKKFPRAKITLCTIYVPWWTGAKYAVAWVGVNMMNKYIKEAAFAHNLSVLDLYSIFTEEQDYANPIEPSPFGSDKITSLMIEIIKDGKGNSNGSTIYNEIITRPDLYTIVIPDSDFPNSRLMVLNE